MLSHWPARLLAPQNAVRALFGEPPLRWSSDLADAAQDWADRLVATGQFDHRPDDPYGEKFTRITGGSASPKQVKMPGLMKPATMTLQQTRAGGSAATLPKSSGAARVRWGVASPGTRAVRSGSVNMTHPGSNT